MNHGTVQSSNYYEELDFEWVNNKIVVVVELANKPYRFILDTGASNIISKELDKQLRPTMISTMSVFDTNNTQDSLKVVSVDKLKFGNVIFEDTYTLVYDFKNSPVWGCFEVDGFIGSNMLRNSIVQIDLKNRKIRLTDNRKKLNLNRKYSSKIELMGIQSSPFVWIDIAGEERGKEQVLIDTGADGLYDLALGSFLKFRDEDIFGEIGESTGASTIGMFGSAELSKHFKLHLPSLKINRLQVADYTVITNNDDYSKIGSELLKYGFVTIDYVNKRFYIDPESEKVRADRADFGLNATLNKRKLIVGFVWDTELKGKLKYGDEIVSIDDSAVNICDIVRRKPFSDNKRDTLKLEVKDKEEGNVFEIVIQKKTAPSIIEK
ncbi:retropepsin-like aspartic protease [Sinomicrobium sp.]